MASSTYGRGPIAYGESAFSFVPGRRTPPTPLETIRSAVTKRSKEDRSKKHKDLISNSLDEFKPSDRVLHAVIEYTKSQHLDLNLDELKRRFTSFKELYRKKHDEIFGKYIQGTSRNDSEYRRQLSNILETTLVEGGLLGERLPSLPIRIRPRRLLKDPSARTTRRRRSRRSKRITNRPRKSNNLRTHSKRTSRKRSNK